ncbi:hypothetical protein JST97_16665 [bacterium]|nr:hypothetical protein [bacterium]
MNEFQVITLVAGLIGFSATVLNLVAFVREKDRSHLKIGLRVLAFMGLASALLFLPRLAPERAKALAEHLPSPVRGLLGGWLAPPAPAAARPPAPAPAPVQASFTLELKRNLLGGVDCLMAHCQFSNLSTEGARLTAFRVSYLDAQGKTTRSFYRVLPAAVNLGGQGHLQYDVELDPEIRDIWVNDQDQEESQRQRVEISWEGQDASGSLFQVSGH